MEILLIIFVAISFFRAFLQVLAAKKNIPAIITTVVTIIHLTLVCVLAFLITINHTSDGTRYFRNGLEVTALVDNPVSIFLVMFLIFGGGSFLIPWIIIELILLQKKVISEMNGAERLASASMFVGIIAFPISIIFAIHLAQRAWPFVLAFCIIGAICGIISCKLRKKNNLKFYKKAVMGIIFSTYYLVVTISMISKL